MDRLSGNFVIAGAIMIAAAVMGTRTGTVANVAFVGGIVLTLTGLGISLKVLGQDGKNP